jgi:hypothetical protein
VCVPAALPHMDEAEPRDEKEGGADWALSQHPLGPPDVTRLDEMMLVRDDLPTEVVVEEISLIGWLLRRHRPDGYRRSV